MPKIFKNGLKLALLLLILVVVALFRVDLNQFKPSIDSQIIQIANSNNLRFKFANSNYSLSKLNFQSVSLAAQSWPIAVEFEQLHLTPTWFNFLKLNPAVQINATAYNGPVEGTLHYSAKSGLGYFIGKAEGLAFERFLPLYSLGVSGNVALNINQLQFSQNQLQKAQIDLYITNANKTNKSSFSLRSWGLPFSIEIPGFENLDLQTSVQIEESKTRITALSLTNSLFRLNLSGTVAPKHMLMLAGDVNFSQAGIDQLGQTLQLIVGERQLVADKLFRLEVRPGLGYPQVILKE